MDEFARRALPDDTCAALRAPSAAPLCGAGVAVQVSNLVDNKTASS